MSTTPRQDSYWDMPGALHASEALTPSQCWALATTQSLGRLGFFHEGFLNIFPVNYFVLDEHLYFRTRADGTIASSYLEHAGFQVDLTDRNTQSGWTVLANGPATRVEDPALLTTLWGKVSEEPWAPGLRDLFYEMAPIRLRGRRLSTAR
ncbi:pyridoxamine 5'-phosphate oxidase family protein [Arthrobacter antioxidans]|uniref:pyridoxamine 5'-phosphate oxidase family protein n=1 Tax=Arthrobacter antioxidans TaxID=2895818 RepID=UPI001FFE4AA2|nr:pyridoxamine 5'-phosphate oxidase family protein [Arthrobacter antioxidans]